MKHMKKITNPELIPTLLSIQEFISLDGPRYVKREIEALFADRK